MNELLKGEKFRFLIGLDEKRIIGTVTIQTNIPEKAEPVPINRLLRQLKNKLTLEGHNLAWITKVQLHDMDKNVYADVGVYLPYEVNRAEEMLIEVIEQLRAEVASYNEPKY